MAVLRRWADAGRCTGCRACEVACSFHHTGAFQPSAASIQVERGGTDGTIWLTLLSTCDGCLEEEVPWCIRYCPRGVLKASVLSLDRFSGSDLGAGT